MEVATCASNLTYSSWVVGSEKIVVGKPNSSLKFAKKCNDQGRNIVLNSSKLRWHGVSKKTRSAEFQLSCSYKNVQAPTVDTETDYNSVDEALILKKKAQDINPYLSGRCIYLVGMMGSGKSTVGKILSEVLGYSFFDSDKLVEQAVGLKSVAQIFQQHSESFFRDNESKVLGELSLMHRLVVATGGGAVIRPINWRYMKHGITVWLDVPLEALARRIAAVGTASRPLIDEEEGDPYTKALRKLTYLSEKRGEVYSNADARVCLQHTARKLGYGDVNELTPTAIAIEALIQIENFVEDEEDSERLERNF
ncbi:shikimate kinase [Ranunculus cassubicifolius]